MSNIARAVGVADKYVNFPHKIPQALADAGLLAPETPEQKTAEDGTPYWGDTSETFYQPGMEPGTIETMNGSGEVEEFPLEEAERNAAALLAAINYVR